MAITTMNYEAGIELKNESNCRALRAAVRLACLQGMVAAGLLGGALAHATDVRPAVAIAAEAAIAFDIPAQSLETALLRFSEQARIQVVVANGAARGAMAPQVRGEYSAAQALHLLLEESALTYEVTDERTVAIRAGAPGAAIERTSLSSDTQSERKHVRVAYATDDADRSSDLQDTGTQAQQPSQVIKLEEVIVTGSHIRGGGEMSAPNITIARDVIEKGGYSSVEDVFRDLPQNFGAISPKGGYGAGASRQATSNADQAASIDLRGLGASSTLILLNGTRRASSNGGLYVDVSTIPVSVIERIDVVTSGRSAIYGADAVAGVVNFVTRRSFQGTQAEAYYLWGRAGGEQLQGTLTTGMQSDRGGFVVAYDYAESQQLNLIGTGAITPISSAGATRLRSDYVPESDRHSGFFSGRFNVNDAVELTADVLYTSKQAAVREWNRFPQANVSTRTDATDNDIYNASVGASFDLFGTWNLRVLGSKSETQNNRYADSVEDRASYVTRLSGVESDEIGLSTVSLVAEGALFSAGGFNPRMAIGAEYREEFLTRASILSIDEFTIVGMPVDVDRQVQSVFVEAQIPILNNGPRGVRHLEFSIAGRYDDYNSVGSSLSPQAGVLWKPIEDLKVAATYSTAFRAPALVEQAPGSSFAFVRELNDPTSGGMSPVLILGGAAHPDLKPEEATVWTVGVEFEPSFAPWARLKAGYFDIDYDNRLEFPTSGVALLNALANEALLPGLINRSPSEADVAAILAQVGGEVTNLTDTAWNPASTPLLTAFPTLVTFRNHLNNIAQESLRGVDLGIEMKFDSAYGVLDFSVDATRSLNHERRITATSPLFALGNQVGRPVDFRLRASAGWTKGAYSFTAQLHYTDSYQNALTMPVSVVPSWTTVDLGFAVDGSHLGSFAEGWKAMFNVRNVFDKKPPYVAATSADYYFDPANADPMGCQITMRVLKKW